MGERVAFVLGGANTLDSDMSVAYSLATPDTIIATNHAGRDFPGKLPHWCTLHTELMQGWMDERRESGRPGAGQMWTSNTKTVPPDHVELYRYLPSWNGSSGLLAVQVALELGYKRIILCGVPLDKKAEHYDYSGPWMDAPRYRSAWTRHLSEIRDYVRSPSGWTQQILGAPTSAWLST